MAVKRVVGRDHYEAGTQGPVLLGRRYQPKLVLALYWFRTRTMCIKACGEQGETV